MNETQAKAYLIAEPLGVIVLFGLSLPVKFSGVATTPLAIVTTVLGSLLTLSIIRYHDRAMHTLR